MVTFGRVLLFQKTRKMLMLRQTNCQTLISKEIYSEPHLDSRTPTSLKPSKASRMETVSANGLSGLRVQGFVPEWLHLQGFVV